LIDEILIFAVTCLCHFPPQSDVEEIAELRRLTIRRSPEQSAEVRISYCIQLFERELLQMHCTILPELQLVLARPDQAMWLPADQSDVY
jgi:hypothetical protein